MKKLAIVLVALFCAYSTYAAPFNPTVTANANFTCNVIIPITMTGPTGTTTLPVVIAGQTRDITDVVLNFSVAGEADFEYILTLTGPTPNNNVSLEGTWSIENGQKTFGATPTTFTYTIDKINADATEETGNRSFTIKAEAEYTGL